MFNDVQTKGGKNTLTVIWCNHRTEQIEVVGDGNTIENVGVLFLTHRGRQHLACAALDRRKRENVFGSST